MFFCLRHIIVYLPTFMTGTHRQDIARAADTGPDSGGRPDIILGQEYVVGLSVGYQRLFQPKEWFPVQVSIQVSCTGMTKTY